MLSFTLNGSWTLYYHPETGALPQTPDELRAAAWPRIEAQVPGNVELDLVRAGLEQDPFYDQNLYNFRKYEFFQWWFERSFDVPAACEGRRCALVFDGLDTYADIFVNGVRVGQADNMFISHEFDVTDALRFGAANTLHVRIRSALNEARKQDFPVMLVGCEGSDEYTRIRKPSSMFGWDIMPRLLSAGMWRGVRLEARDSARLTQVYVATTQANENAARLICRVRFETDDAALQGYSVRVAGRCGDSSFSREKVLFFVSGSMDIDVPAPRLWWPAGYGAQNLYDTTVELLKDGQVLDTWTLRVGIRRFEIVNILQPGDAGEFKIVCNGTPILAKGSNWVPMDAMHSRDAARVDAAMALFRDCGCNIVRCWGGNVYEDHHFFDLCDEYGVMVWQDFAMACAAYPTDAPFVAALEKEATSVVRKLRNHPSILLWAGDNECDEGQVSRGYPNDMNRYNPLTREVLPRVVSMNDPWRVFLPSSPYIPAGIARYDVPEQHNWGARAYFKDDFYKHSSAHFISECGYHGCPAVSSLKKFIPADKLAPWLDNDSWDTHDTDYLPKGRRGYSRVRLMHDQVRIFFGEAPEELAAFCRLSQIVQAEAKKFFIERTRIKKWRRTGIIWWNMIDGWPQISDAVVDYYYAKKLAYHYIRRVQRPICLMMDELVDWTHAVVLGNDSRDSRAVSWRIEDGDTGEVILSGETLSPANENVTVGSIREMAGTQKLYILRWTIDGVEYANHYLSGFPRFDAEKTLGYVDIIKALPEPFDWTD
ncbi:MAG: glycoside hydrolase family 2 [Clostridia bacterium]|nr:glycoside hydrolase family 2 [Clostridia bacterium]